MTNQFTFYNILFKRGFSKPNELNWTHHYIMSSAICQNFVQNAWKKELCSNCFKSKDEHQEKPKPKPVQLIPSDKVEGIIKNGKTSKSKQSVCFHKELTKIIGYGGEDWCSDTEDNVDNESSEDDIILDSDDDDSYKELQRITKENTDFNTVSLKDTEVKKSYTQLLLGKPLIDASGKKQTLLVSVTPFGEDSSTAVKKLNTKNLSHIPIAKNNKEIIAENKTNVVLTSYTKNEEEKTTNEEKSLLDEISETLENSKNPIQIMGNKRAQKQVHINIMDSNKENIETIDNEVENEEENMTNKILVSEKKINLCRTPALKKDVEKPVIYQTSTAKIELINAKNLKINKENINNAKVKSSEKITTTTTDPKKDIITTTNFIKAEILHSKANNPATKIIKDEINTNVANSIEKTNDSNTHPPPLPVKYIPFSQTREQAGKPDGSEDPVSTELPPLPRTPPPPILESQTSFLHGISPPIYEKPKIPSKPTGVILRKSINNSPVLTVYTKPNEKPSLVKQDSNDSELKSNKRKAPLPPEETYSRTSSGDSTKDDDPIYVSAEVLSRKSLSTDCLAVEDKRKEKNKARFSLKKFLRMGSNKDISKLNPELSIKQEDYKLQSKPRLVIVHPSELNGTKIEVVSKPILDQTLCHEYSTPTGDYETYNSSFSKASKPPPPPRNFTENNTNNKPNLPTPPKSVEILNKQRQLIRNNSNSKKQETVYANIGEVRSSIVPNKPVRTASMREREAALQQKQIERKLAHNYEPIDIRKETENVYDYINSTRSSSPESEKGSPKSKTIRLGKRSESSIDVSSEYYKYGNIPRSMSLTYCGSETESEIYSPYSFYGSESEVTEDDHDWIQNGRTHKLRSRKGRSIVHKNLEDNYGAVVVANHEALAQVLENIQQINHIQPALRGLKTVSNLRWTDFSIKSTTQPVLVGTRVFHQALWGTHHVTLSITAGTTTSSTMPLGTFNLTPIIEFSDLIPSIYLTQTDTSKEDDNKQIQATAQVLPYLQINTIQTYGEILRTKSQEESWRDSNFVMLQLVNALKTIQAQGIEEVPLSLHTFVLCKDMDKEGHHRLCVLQGIPMDVATKTNQEKHGTLCTCALKALNLLQPSPKITPLLQSLLSNERAVSLTQVKSVLEFSLWGPSDVSLGSTIKERELALQRWLDLQRATVLHGLVCTRVQLTVYEECHLLFLVRSNARMMCDASLLIESSNLKHSVGFNQNRMEKCLGA
ncbi:uncharacterized protein LOC130449285 isoform X1 [Diorhabda sublineata]|uniref:uncharacterized protein LOC130449285 isoform X1 n=2 Tax=Diorhabda sublineata TaxID=1163346 RepID=UPI0024E0BFA0|nr:uncharacterized protein LOC130449285 isoform X1 [Diorhabda sublineata]